MTSLHENSSSEIRRPMTVEQMRSLPGYQAMTPTERAALLMEPFEKVSAKQRESVRLLDAQQSLSSPLYQQKAEELGMEEYFRRYSTSRVR